MVNAGHPAPLLIHRGGCESLESQGPPFGVLPGVTYQAAIAGIPEGGTLAIFSDGIPEARHGAEFFGEERLHAALVEAAQAPDLAEMRKRIFARLDGFLGDAPHSDDITLLLIRRQAAPGE